MRISANTGRCVGAGQCVLQAPEVFDQDEDAMVTLHTDRPGEAARAAVSEAANLCPAGAITIHED
ncbi:ferredoxin [Amycolatopsis aidingensis]|uniref:ferredoxin n=1 Tax=Amycolatopsis aidingensis TaxID=2842453 RepID=UPI001C0E662C|nr:(4Fe-4S)-binding protein [Amycolatopsis aidingensis]